MATSVIKVDNKQMESKQAELGRLAASIVVKDASTCLEAKTAQRQIRDELKLRHAVLDPFVSNAKSAYDQAKDERSKWIDPLDKLDELLAMKVKDYDRLERERAQREQEELNRQKREREAREADERRREAEKQAEIERKAREKEIAEARKAGDLKAAEAKRLQKLAEEEAERKRQQAKADADAEKANFRPIEVKPNVPTVAGVPSRRTYKAEVTDPVAFIKEYAKRYIQGAKLGETPAFELAAFITIDVQAVGRQARDMKDPKAFMERYPFTRAWEE